MTALDYTIVAVFLGVMAAAGLFVSRMIRDSDDMFVAGRQLTPFILAATITATNLSMFHFVGMGGTASQNGISIIWQNWTGNMALVLSGIFVLPLMRRLRLRTIPEYLEMRYARGLRTLVGAFWGIRLTIYLGVLLYIAATAAMFVTGWQNYVGWLVLFSLVAVLYSVVGGAWAVALMDSVQFVVMLAAALVIFPVAMHYAGGLPAIIDHFKTSQHRFVELVPHDGAFNWVFVLSIMLLGLKFASIDQAILQRAFGAQSPRVGAKGMVLSGLITTPMAFLWILPGLAIAKLHPAAFAKPDDALPWLLATYMPQVVTGLLGFVLCGLVAAQVSVITADVNSISTLFASDVYRTLRRREPSQRQLVNVVRISSLIAGVAMIGCAILIKKFGSGAVNVNLVVVGILDMPLFIITVVYGMTWSRINWQGALAGFVCGGIAAAACYFTIAPEVYIPGSLGARVHAGEVGLWSTVHAYVAGLKPFIRAVPPIAGATAALIVTPIVALLTPPSKTDRGRRALQAATDAAFAKTSTGPSAIVDDFTFIPQSLPGRIGAAAAVSGFATFLVGVLSASQSAAWASSAAVAGLIIVLAGGLLRVYSR